VFCWSFVSPFVFLLPDALRTELRATLRLAGPVVAAQLAHISMGFVDTVMVGRLGPDALAVQLLGVAAVFQLFDGLQVAAHGALQGLKDTRVSMSIAMGTVLGHRAHDRLPVGRAARRWTRGAVVGLVVGLAAAAVLLLLRFHRQVGRAVRKEGAVPAEEAPVSASPTAAPLEE
jgi:MATE family multidrug resistance protein